MNKQAYMLGYKKINPQTLEKRAGAMSSALIGSLLGLPLGPLGMLAGAAGGLGYNAFFGGEKKQPQQQQMPGVVIYNGAQVGPQGQPMGQ
jgi:hypothetical protein